MEIILVLCLEKSFSNVMFTRGHFHNVSPDLHA